MTALLLVLTACRQETPAGADLVEVAIAVDLPQQVTTRAISDGMGAIDLHFRVYRVQDGTVECVISLSQDIHDAFDNLHAELVTHLVPGQTYNFVFWAQNAGAADAYDLGGLLSAEPFVKIDYARMPNSEDCYDAFCKSTLGFLATDDQTFHEVLTRPFAQINFGCTAEDWADAGLAGVVADATSLTVSDVYTRLNMFDGSVSDPVDVTFLPAAMPDERLVVEEAEYMWLSMDYVLVPAERSVSNLSLGLYRDGWQMNSVRVSDVPVRRNWRTNIVGRILTTTTGFSITADPVFSDEINIGLQQE